MLEDLFNNLLVLYERDDAHLALTFGASKRIYLIDFLYKTSPIFSVLFGWSVWFEGGGNHTVLVLFFPFSAWYIAIMAIISDHLLSLVGVMWSHGRQPFQGIKDLFLLSVFGPIDNLGLLGDIYEIATSLYGVRRRWTGSCQNHLTHKFYLHILPWQKRNSYQMFILYEAVIGSDRMTGIMIDTRLNIR